MVYVDSVGGEAAAARLGGQVETDLVVTMGVYAVCGLWLVHLWRTRNRPEGRDHIRGPLTKRKIEGAKTEREAATLEMALSRPIGAPSSCSPRQIDVIPAQRREVLQ